MSVENCYNVSKRGFNNSLALPEKSPCGILDAFIIIPYVYSVRKHALDFYCILDLGFNLFDLFGDDGSFAQYDASLSHFSHLL